MCNKWNPWRHKRTPFFSLEENDSCSLNKVKKIYMMKETSINRWEEHELTSQVVLFFFPLRALTFLLDAKLEPILAVFVDPGYACRTYSSNKVDWCTYTREGLLNWLVLSLCYHLEVLIFFSVIFTSVLKEVTKLNFRSPAKLYIITNYFGWNTKCTKDRF